MRTDFSKILLEKTEECNRIIEALLPPCEGQQETVLEAMSYAVRAGGKRLRPLIMRESYLLFPRDEAREAFMRPVLEACMAAMEMIHTFSLCHDDLPCMDNDKYRRGKVSCWYRFGEAMGTLAGDALSLYAFELVSGACLRQLAHCQKDGSDAPLILGQAEEGSGIGSFRLAEERGKDPSDCLGYMQDVMEAISILSGRSGVYGMLGGQVVDVEKTGESLKEEQLAFIYRLKTGALLAASAGIGACLAGAGRDSRRKLEELWEKLGVAFQIRDDILDETSDTATLGKSAHSDRENGKTTYVSLHGVVGAEEQVERLSGEAAEMLRQLPRGEVAEEHRAFLLDLVEFLARREK